MKQFKDAYSEQIKGQLEMFDRILFKGHLTAVYPVDRFSSILYNHGVLLKEFTGFAQESTKQLKRHLAQMAETSEREIIYLPSGRGKRGESKEELARQLAAEEGIEEGLITIYSTLELAGTLCVRGERQTGYIRLVSEKRKQLHYYLYYMDKEFGLMFVRIQSWWPFTIHIYINGREWLARQMDEQGIEYQKVDNCFYEIADMEQAQKLCDKFAHRQWERVWNAFAKRTNPLLSKVMDWTGQGYYWTSEQTEIATDIMFSDQATLDEMLPELFQEMLLTQSAEDVMRFLGRKLYHSFQGKVESKLNKRQPGWRVKHWVKQNSIKMYNRGNILRVETTINNSGEFKIPAPKGKSPRWKRMPKGVSYFWHFYQVGRESNQRYIDALHDISYQGKAALDALDSLCQSHEQDGRRSAKFQPVTQDTCQLFAAILNAGHALTGIRNCHVRAVIYGQPSTDKQIEQRRRARVSRLLAKLRGHGLIEKAEHSHLYRVTTFGFQAMSAAMRYRHIDYPFHFAAA